jgi:hypothetical protein
LPPLLRWLNPDDTGFGVKGKWHQQSGQW